MRISDRYIGRQILSGTLFAIVLLTVLLVLGNVFKEIRPILVEYGAPFWVLGQFILNVLPISLIFTIPWAFLSAVLLVFGRLSSEYELTAFRTAGLSLVRLAAPVFVLGAALSGLCLWLNLNVTPHAKREVDNVRVIAAKTVLDDPSSLLRAATRQHYIENLKIDAESNEGELFHNFHLFVLNPKDPTEPPFYLHGDTARTLIDQEDEKISLRFHNAVASGISEPGDFIRTDDLRWIVLDYSPKLDRFTKPNAMTNAEIDRFMDEHPDLAKRFAAGLVAEKARRYSSSLACLAFALIGVPLGITARRRDTSSGLLLSLGIGAAYFVGGSMLGGSEGQAWMVWVPNLLCVALGILLFRRARFR